MLCSLSRCLLFVVAGLKYVGCCCLVAVGWLLLFVVRGVPWCLPVVGCWMMYDVCCLLVAVCGLGV